MKRRFSVKNVLRLLLIIICGAVIGTNLYMTNAKKLVGNQLPMPFGYGAAVVLSGSMEPEFSIGDLIVVKETTDYKEKDIVVYQEGAILVVHRILSMDGETVITKGDANNAADDPIDVSVIKGKVLFSIPYAGTIVSMIKTPVGTLIIAGLAIALVEIPRRREKKKDDEERDKILEEIKRLKEEQEN